ncbi:MAG: phosphatidate cytidylyltransferase [candidate division Zixibacteria bacterium]|nr:phosphatidate cytidylyltransferase [candidate division Zixibacteria bacterium]
MNFNRNLLSRIAVAIIAVPAIVYISLRGGILILIFTVVLSILGAIELTNLFKNINNIFSKLLLIGASVLIIILLYYDKIYLTGAVFLFTVLISAAFGSFSNDISRLRGVVIESLFAVFYCGFFLAFIPLLTKYPDNGGKWLLSLFVIIWCSDTAAYFGGKMMGKRKLSPAISPGKTIEGLWWGFAGAVLSALIIKSTFLNNANMYFIVFVAVILSGIGAIGDLFESSLKRNAGIKDSSTLIPGHGGVLDRFDSVLFAAPTLYLLLGLRDLFC